MRYLITFFVALIVALPLQVAFSRDDAQLTKLMVGAWRTPRHDYIYYPDGTWWMGKPEPHIAHGLWRIKDGHLQTSLTYGDDKGPEPTGDDGIIQKLTLREVLYGDGYSMRRIRMKDVDEPHSRKD